MATRRLGRDVCRPAATGGALEHAAESHERIVVKVITPDRFDAVLFDLDGVLTSTASIHSRCWKTTFDEFLSHRAETTGEAFRPFDLDRDYRQYVDGKLRYDGARSFLASRGLSLPEGTPGDPPTAVTVCGIGNRKDDLVEAAIDRGEVEVYAGSVELVRALRECGIRTAVVSSSKNCERVLRAGDILDLFDARVDGVVASELGLPGKPAPDMFLKAADMLSVRPARAVVVEDAIAGVEAGRDGGFGLVVGVNHGGKGDALRAHGADIVVTDLAELLDA